LTPNGFQKYSTPRTGDVSSQCAPADAAQIQRQAPMRGKTARTLVSSDCAGEDRLRQPSAAPGMREVSMVRFLSNSAFKAALIGTALISDGAALGQQSTAGQRSEIFLKATQATRSAFCKSAGLLSCLQLDRPTCEARLKPIVDKCAKDPGAAGTSQSEGLVRGYFTGCVLMGILAQHPRSKEAMACIQQAGKK